MTDRQVHNAGMRAGRGAALQGLGEDVGARRARAYGERHGAGLTPRERVRLIYLYALGFDAGYAYA